MTETAVNDEANADASASGTSRSREMDVDGDDGEEFRIFLSQSRSPNQDASNPLTSPLPLPTMEMEIASEDDPPMPASQIAVAFEETEEGPAMKSPTAAAAAPLSSTNLNPTPPHVRLASAREELAAPAAQLPQDAPTPDAALLVKLESMTPPMSAALRGAIFEDKGEGQMAYEKTKTIEGDDFQQAQGPPTPTVPRAPSPTPVSSENMDAASLERRRERVRHQQEEILQQARGPPTPAKASLKRKRKRVRRQQEQILQKAHGSHTQAEQDGQHPSTNPPVRARSLPAITTQPGAGSTLLGRTQSVIMLPMRPPPRSMLPPSDDDDDGVTNTSSVSTLQAVEATLYEQDSVIYLGTPVENDHRPWWKKCRMSISIAVSGLIAGSAVALWATLGFSREPVTASSQPSETQSSLPSFEPSQSSPPSKIPSLRPTLHPSQSLAPTSVRSAPPSASLVPSILPSSSSSTPPSASTLPTAFCFEGAINIFTDSYPEDTSWPLSRITTEEGVPTAEVVREGSPEEENSLHTYDVCLERSEYEFTIYDRFGDGMCCDNGAGHFELELDGWVVLEGGEFESSQTGSFSLPTASLPPSRSSVPSRSLIPTVRPSTSFGPSSQVPSLVPTLSLRPSALPSLLPTAPPSTYWSSLIWEQNGQTINGESPGDHSGRSVVLSSNGMTMAIGSPGAADNFNRPGYVKVYHRDDSASSWQDLGQKIEGTANGNRFGESLAFSEDGRTLAIGAPGLSFIPGYVRVYQMEEDGPGSSWKQLGQDITREGGGNRFGVSIALSANGRTLAIGDLVACDAAGLVRIYGWDEDGSSWKQLGQDLKGEDSPDFSGFSVDLSSDGMTVAIGAWANNGNGLDSGHVRVYLRKGDGLIWEQLGQDIDGEAPGDQSGFSVSLSADGKMIAIGAVFYDGNGDIAGYVNNAGYVRVYRIDDAGPSWEQFGQDIDGEAAGDRFGSSLSLSADGKTVAIGAPSNDGNGPISGHVRVYRMEDGPKWIQVGQDIDGGTAGDNAGWAVSLSADGRTVVVGSPSAGVDWGHVRVFNVNY